MTSPIKRAPRCDFHPMLSATLHCSSCNNLQCKLCAAMEGTAYKCVSCGTALVTANQDALEHAVKRQTQVFQRATSATSSPEAGSPANKPPSSTGMPRNSTTKVGFGFSAFPTDTGNAAKTPSGALPPPGGKSLRELAGLPSKEGQVSPTGTPEIPPAAGAAPVAGAPAPVLPPGKKLPPYKCKGHPDLLATRGCDRCREHYCNACAKMIEDNPRCPECSAQLIVIPPEIQGRAAVSLPERLVRALTFPFQGDGKLMFVIGSLMLYGFSFMGWRGRGVALLILYAYLMKICKTSAIGRESPPDWPDGEDFFGLKDLFLAKLFSYIPAILYLVLAGYSIWALVDNDARAERSGRYSSETFTADTSDIRNPNEPLTEDDIPDGVTMPEPGANPPPLPPGQKPRSSNNFFADNDPSTAKLRKKNQDADDREDQLSGSKVKSSLAVPAIILLPIPFYLLVLAGSFYLPMATLAATLFRSVSALNPVFVFGSIGKVAGDYMGIYFLLVIAETVVTVGSVFAGFVPFVGAFFIDAAWLYLMMVQMRVLGEMYCINRRKLAWFDVRD